MKLSRILIGSASVSMALFTAAYAAQPQKSDQPKDNGSSVAEADAKSFFKKLAGQWEGQIQTTRGSDVSASVVTVSNRVEDKGATLASCFEGFAFGQVVDGALVCKHNAQTSQIDNAWFDSERNATIRSSVKGGDHSQTITFAGSFTDAKTSKATSFELVFQIDGSDKYSVQYVVVAEGGAKTKMLTMDLERMKDGQKCAAADRFDDSSLMGKVRSSQQASAESSK